MASEQQNQSTPAKDSPVVVVTTTQPPDYELRFDGLRTQVLVRSESLVAFRYEDGERKDSAKLASLEGATPFSKQAVHHFAQAVVDCLNAGVKLEVLREVLENASDLAENCPWPRLQSIGYDVAGMTVERPAVVQYIMHNSFNDQVIVVTPDISERTMPAAQYSKEYQSRYE